MACQANVSARRSNRDRREVVGPGLGIWGQSSRRKRWAAMAKALVEEKEYETHRFCHEFDLLFVDVS